MSDRAARLQERDEEARQASKLYFGCWQGIGHFFWLPGMKRAPGRPLTPWGWGVEKLAPGTMTQGTAAIHHRDGWTALAVDDFTVDRRGNSKSVFCFHADLDYDELLFSVVEHFPEVERRIGEIKVVQ